MPTVLRAPPFRVIILNPPREHGPPHVHIRKGFGVGEGEVVIALGVTGNGVTERVSVREVYQMATRDVVAAVRLVEANLAQLREQWRALHGEADSA